MPVDLRRGVNLELSHHLLFFSGLLVAASVAYIPYAPGPLVPHIPAIAIPLTVAVGLLLLTIRVRPKRYESGQAEQIVGYGWLGTLVAAGIGGWWLAIHLSSGFPVRGLIAEILAIVSVGFGAGVVFGTVLTRNPHRSKAHDALVRSHRRDQVADRDRILEETTWTGRQEPAPIFAAIVETLADLEGVDPINLEPIYDYVNPAAFTELRRQQRSQWQLTFYTETYEIRVSSLGTVTFYDAAPSDDTTRSIRH